MDGHPKATIDIGADNNSLEVLTEFFVKAAQPKEKKKWLMIKLLNELERRKGKYGLQTMCIGHGMATATIIERL